MRPIGIIVHYYIIVLCTIHYCIMIGVFILRKGMFGIEPEFHRKKMVWIHIGSKLCVLGDRECSHAYRSQKHYRSLSYAQKGEKSWTVSPSQSSQGTKFIPKLISAFLTYRLQNGVAGSPIVKGNSGGEIFITAAKEIG